jgi:thioredoxin 1
MKRKRFKRNEGISPVVIVLGVGVVGVGAYFLYKKLKGDGQDTRGRYIGHGYEPSATTSPGIQGRFDILRAARNLASFVTGKAPAPSRVVTITDANFNDEVLHSDKPVLLDVMATWCEPCKAISPVFDKQADTFGNEIKFAKMNLEDSPELAKKLGATMLPSLFAFNKAAPVAQQVGGVTPDVLNQFIAKVLPAKSP